MFLYEFSKNDLRQYDILACNSRQEVLDIVESLDGTQIGDGTFSIVFQGQGKFVVKLSTGLTDGWLDYGYYAKNNWIQNKHLPRIIGIKEFEHEDGYVAISEFLLTGNIQELKESLLLEKWADTQETWQALFRLQLHFQNYMSKNGKPTEFYEKFIDVFGIKMQEIYEFVWKRYSNGVMIDMRIDNWGVRGGSPVVNDPLSLTI